MDIAKHFIQTVFVKLLHKKDTRVKSASLQRIFNNLGDLINGATGSSLAQFFQPTFGVSFGLPQQGPGYGGYQQNPVGTGGAVNPYYTADKKYSNGLAVGGVDVNPLVSFQATTNENGSVVAKPLINLHLTPNGCGIFGCDDHTKSGNRYPDAYPDNDYYYDNRRQQVKFQDSGFRPSAPYRPQEDYRRPYRPERPYRETERPYRQDQLRPEVVQAIKQATDHRRVKFGSDQVVKHEHHHFHHHVDSGSNGFFRKNQGISFGFDSPSFRSGEGLKNDDLLEANNVKKRKVSFGEPEKDQDEEEESSGFRFPHSRQIKSRKRRSPPSAQEEDIKPVIGKLNILISF